MLCQNSIEAFFLHFMAKLLTEIQKYAAALATD